MRRPIKPFAVEVRRSSRKSSGAGPKDSVETPEAAPAQPAREPLAGPAPEDQDHGYLAALRAADALFGKAEPHRPAATPASRAAESYFKTVESDPTPEPMAAPASTGRILPSLLERNPVHDMLESEHRQELEDDAAPQKLRVRETIRSRHSAVRRLKVSASDELAYAAHFDRAPGNRPDLAKAVAEPSPTQPTVWPSLHGYVRGRIYARWVTHEAIRPGERWKLRLGRLVR